MPTLSQSAPSVDQVKLERSNPKVIKEGTGRNRAGGGGRRRQRGGRWGQGWRRGGGREQQL